MSSPPSRFDAGAGEPDRPAPQVEVRRSTRRRRTVSAYRDGATVVVLIPSIFSRAQEREWVERMLARLEAKEHRARRGGDAGLTDRADRLARQYLDPQVTSPVRPISIRWVANQRGRWGSCTPRDGTIRISERLLGMPEWVVDYVILHELAHLLTAGHGPDFWALLERYPRTSRAKGFLEGVAYASGLPPSEVDPE
jgi:predicted metal-dependent hydrolase